MQILLIVFLLFCLAFAGLALGVILRKKSLRGGCSGPARNDCGVSSCACASDRQERRLRSR